MRETSFSKGLSGISDDTIPFFDELSFVGRRFDDCFVDWSQTRKKIIEGLFNSSQKLEKFTILEVLPKILSEVADVTPQRPGWV